MARYYFNVHDGLDGPDLEGTELIDSGTACREAVRLAGKLLEEGADQPASFRSWRMEVLDVAGQTVVRLDVQLTIG